MKPYQLEFAFMKPQIGLEELLNRCALRDDIVMLNESNYDEWDRLNRVDELAAIYKLPAQAIKDYQVLYRYLAKKEIATPSYNKDLNT